MKNLVVQTVSGGVQWSRAMLALLLGISAPAALHAQAEPADIDRILRWTEPTMALLRHRS